MERCIVIVISTREQNGGSFSVKFFVYNNLHTYSTDTLIAIKVNGSVPNEIAVLAHVLVHLL